MKSIYFTKEGYNALQKEQEDTIKQRKLAVLDLAKAREMGDLSENGYYKAARFKLSSIDRRLRELKHLLKVGVIKEKGESTIVDIGSTVTISDGKVTKTYTIVGSYESNPSESKISHISPLGNALIGKTTGESVSITLATEVKKFQILDIQ